MRFLIVVWVSLLLPVIVSAQQAIITGTVSDQYTRDPLPGASVIFGRGKGTVTHNDGFFRLEIQAGNAALRFQYMGYKAAIKELSLLPGDSVHLTIFMEPEATQIDQVVISAGRVEQRVAESTVSMSVISPRQFTTAHIHDSRELITKSPGVEVIDGQAAIRGGSGYSYGAGSRVLTLIDGLPILAADAGNIRWQFLPLENIAQIEIIKGASSVLYGSSALNGVINFRTQRATQQGRTTFYTESALFDNPPNPDWKWWGNTPRTSQAVSVSHLKKYNQTEVSTALFGLFDPGYRKRNHEHIARFNLNLRRPLPFINGLDVGLNTLTGYTDKSDFVLWENAWDGALIQDEATSINLRSTFLAIDPFLEFRPDEKQRHDLKIRFQVTDNAFPDAPNNESTAISLFSEYQNWYDINPLINVTAGVSQTTSMIISEFYGDHQALNLAAYLQTDFSLLQRLRLVGGIRAEHNRLNEETNDPVVLFRAGANYMLTNFTFLRTSFGQGYRYPSIAEKFATTTLGAVRIFPNTFLQPESGWNAEVGVKQGLRALNWDGLIDLALFYNENKDLIEYLFGFYYDPVTQLSYPGFRAENTEYSRVYGLETEFIFTRQTGLSEQTLRGGYVYTMPVELNPNTGKNSDVYLKYRRKHSAQLGFMSQFGKWAPGIDLFYRSAFLNIDRVFVDPFTREAILPGFYDYWTNKNRGHFLADINLAYQLNPGYTLSVAVKNLTNLEYMGRPGDIRPHRSISIRLSGSF